MTLDEDVDAYRTLVDVARAAGVSYRQADLWVRAGHITPINIDQARHVRTDVPATAPGSGYTRVLDDTEATVLALMARLVAAGLRPSQAATIARTTTTTGDPLVDLGHGIALLINPALGDTPSNR